MCWFYSFGKLYTHLNRTRPEHMVSISHLSGKSNILWAANFYQFQYNIISHPWKSGLSCIDAALSSCDACRGQVLHRTLSWPGSPCPPTSQTSTVSPSVSPSSRSFVWIVPDEAPLSHSVTRVQTWTHISIIAWPVICSSFSGTLGHKTMLLLLGLEELCTHLLHKPLA